jgi:hypothetical protein
MRSYLRLASVCVFFLLAVSLSASANSSNDGFNNVNLTGVPGGGTVSGAFSFNSQTGLFSNISVSFVSSLFGNINASDPFSIYGTKNNAGQYSFQFQAFNLKGGDWITYNVLYNPLTNQFSASGSIANLWNQGNFNYMSAPEGGAQLSYLLLSGLAMFVGILMSRKQRRAHTVKLT